ncbi:hypothetical protein ES702_05102 [subsurface metagenome]
MSTNQEQGARCAGQTASDAALDTLKSQMPELSRLFANLDAGYTPNILDMIAAISEMVAFYTKSDQIDEVLGLIEDKMSLNKCRFCS